MKKIHILAVVLAATLLPTLTLAEGIVPCDGPDCQTCHIVVLGQNLLTWLIGISAAVIALFFVIGGLKMVMSGGNEGQVTSARTMMTNAIIGFVILLGSWLIIDTVLKVFLTGNDIDQDGTAEINGYGPWNTIECTTQPDTVVNDLPSGGGAVEGETSTEKWCFHGVLNTFPSDVCEDTFTSCKVKEGDFVADGGWVRVGCRQEG